MVKDNSKKYEDTLYEAMSRHSSLPAFGLLVGLALIWLLVLTPLSNNLKIEETLPSFTLSPTLVIFLVGLLNIYIFVNALNRRQFRKKYHSAAREKGFSEAEIEAHISKREIENMIMRGDMHSNLKKSIERLRRE